MPFDDADDLAEMFDDADFSHTATLNAVASGNVIEDTEYLLALGMIATNERAVMARASEYTTSAVGGTLAYNSASYTIRARKAIPPDGKVVMLQLEKQ